MSELANPVDRQLPTVAGFLDTPKGESRIGGHHAVNEHHSSLDIINQALTLTLVICPCARAQPEAAVVGDSNSVIEVFRTEHGGYRTKQLFAICRRISGNVLQDRRWIVIARSVKSLATSQNARARFHRLLNIAIKRSHAISGRE